WSEMFRVAQHDNLRQQSRTIMQTSCINLLPHTPEHLRALLDGSEAYERRFGIRVAEGVKDFLTGPEVSADFLAQLNGVAAADPWKDGFAVVHVADNIIIGLCSFTGPPSANETVEIAYGITPDYRGSGYASEAAQALIDYAAASGQVRTIRAHTLPEHNASTSVLLKCGFTRIGEFTHSEDGVVWRWELQQKV
ncbi:MAG: GNAT family N-acetyltransferase, partial [Verrucomicrobiota bacterium]